MHLTITWECLLYLNKHGCLVIFVSCLNCMSHIKKKTNKVGSVHCTLQNKFSFNVLVSSDPVSHTTKNTLKMLGVFTVCYKTWISYSVSEFHNPCVALYKEHIRQVGSVHCILQNMIFLQCFILLIHMSHAKENT